MQHVLQHSSEWPDWRADAASRLNISMLVATVVVIGILSVIRFPTFDLLAPMLEIAVNIVSVDEPLPVAAPVPPIVDVPIPVTAPVPQVVDEPLPQSIDPVAEPAPVQQDAEQVPPPIAAPPEPAIEFQSVPGVIGELSIDWEDEKARAIQNAIDAMERTASVNPNFDQLRREAAIKFRPSRAPVKKEIWDYVEKDQAGRTVLQFGNFYQVLDDPRLFNRDAFLTFQRHMVFATYRKHIPKELPWVKDIRNNHAYLRIREDRRNGIFETE